MPNKFDSYDVVRFHQTDSETSQAQEFEGVVGGFSRTDSGDYVYQVYVAEKDAGYTIQERSLTRTGRVSPAEYRQIVAQRTAPALPLSTEGFVAHEPALVASSQSSHSATPSIRSSSIPSSNRYTALRGLVSLASIFAQLSVVAGIIGVVGGLIATGTPFVGGLGWIIVLLSVFAGAISYFIFQAAAESILVLLDMESNTREAENNTRETANYLQQVVALLEERQR